MTDLQHPTVWQLMAAFASDEYEMRQVAPGEYEIVPAGQQQTDDQLISEADGHDQAATIAEMASTDGRQIRSGSEA